MQLPHGSWSDTGLESWHSHPNPDDDITTQSSVIPALAPAATIHMISIALNPGYITANASLLPFFPFSHSRAFETSNLDPLFKKNTRITRVPWLCNLNGPLLMSELQVFRLVQHWHVQCYIILLIRQKCSPSWRHSGLHQSMPNWQRDIMNSTPVFLTDLGHGTKRGGTYSPAVLNYDSELIFAQLLDLSKQSSVIFITQ